MKMNNTRTERKYFKKELIILKKIKEKVIEIMNGHRYIRSTEKRRLIERFELKDMVSTYEPRLRNWSWELMIVKICKIKNLL